MRIECPSCRTAYEVPEQKLPGRQLRCAACQHQWIAVVPLSNLEPALPAPKPTVTLAIPAEDAARFPISRTFKSRLAKPSGGSRATPWVAMGWAASILICGAGTYAAFALRSPVMHAWHPSIRLYHAIGLDRPAAR